MRRQRESIDPSISEGWLAVEFNFEPSQGLEFGGMLVLFVPCVLFVPYASIDWADGSGLPRVQGCLRCTNLLASIRSRQITPPCSADCPKPSGTRSVGGMIMPD